MLMSFAQFASTTSPLAYRPPERPKPKRPLEEPYPIGTRLRVIGRPDNRSADYTGREYVVDEVNHSVMPAHGQYWYRQRNVIGMWSNYVEVISDE